MLKQCQLLYQIPLQMFACQTLIKKNSKKIIDRLFHISSPQSLSLEETLLEKQGKVWL